MNRYTTLHEMPVLSAELKEALGGAITPQELEDMPCYIERIIYAHPRGLAFGKLEGEKFEAVWPFPKRIVLGDQVLPEAYFGVILPDRIYIDRLKGNRGPKNVVVYTDEEPEDREPWRKEIFNAARLDLANARGKMNFDWEIDQETQNEMDRKLGLVTHPFFLAYELLFHSYESIRQRHISKTQKEL